MKVVARLGVTLISILVAWLGMAQPASASPAPMLPTAVYGYSSQIHTTTPSMTYDCERPSPATYNDATAYDPDGMLSPGYSARPAGAATSEVYDYDGIARFAQPTRGSQTTEVRGGDPSAPPFAVDRSGSAANTASGAESALSGSLLRTHLRQLEKYGQGGFRELESGRFRYYGNLSPAAKEGEMAGRRLVREWDPATGYTRTWHETIDQAGNIRIVRPETGGPKTHYYFDEFGNYGGAW